MATNKKLKRRPPVPTPGKSLVGWSWFSNGPLKGCGLLRERQWIYAWDDANTIYLLDLTGQLIAQRRAPREVIAVAGADTGQCLVAIGRSGAVWWLDSELEPQVEISCPFDPLSVAVDPHGNYAIISSQNGLNVICNSAGKQVCQFETTRPLKYLAFSATSPHVVGSAEHGLVTCHDFKGENEWYSTLWSNVGGMAIDGDAEAVLLACFGHGIVRYDAAGVREGTYRYDQSPGLVACDFEGSVILAASLERTLTELNFEGNIRATKSLPDKPIGLALDALGRYGILGYANGEVRLFGLPGFFSGDEQTDMALAAGSSDGRSATPTPSWETRAAHSLEEVDSAVMEVAPGGAGLALFTNRRTMRIFDADGELRHETEPMTGLGRILRVTDGWMAAATDTRLVAYNPATNESKMATVAAHEISHLQLFREFGDALLVESCEYICRFQFPEKKRWKRQSEYRVESAAVLPKGATALSLEDHNVVVYAPDGSPMGKYRSKPAEPLHLTCLDNGWVTAARDARVVRGHEPDGKLLWARPLPWAPWTTRRLGEFILVTSAEGFSLLMNQEGEIIGENKEPRENARYFVRANGKVARIFQVEQTLIVTTMEGRLLWRYADEHRIGSFLAGPAGVWVFLGRLLTFFPFE